MATIESTRTGEQSVVGGSDPNITAHAKATGQTVYADDLHLPRMLIGKLLRSPFRHARILRVDVGRAAALPGVHGILTGEDLPILFGIMPVAQDEHALALEKVRYHGEPVAAVAAIDEETAEEAVRLIEVEYEELAPVSSIEDALDPELPLIAGNGPGRQVNRLGSLEFGDVDKWVRAGRPHVRGSLLLRGQHAPADGGARRGRAVGAGAARAGDGLVVDAGTALPAPHAGEGAGAATRPHPRDRDPVGGGFGGKSDPFSHELCAARLAMMTGRPVKFALTREEVFYAHRGRHPVLMRCRPASGRRRAHRRCVPNDARRWRLRQLRPATMYYTGALQTVTYDVPVLQVRGRPPSRTSLRAAPSADTAHRSRASRSSASSTRSPSTWGSTRSTCA